MLNLRIFFYGAAPKERELQQMEALGKLCGYFWGLLGSDGHKRAWGAQQRGERCCPTSGGSATCVRMLQSTGHKEIWDDTEDS